MCVNSGVCVWIICVLVYVCIGVCMVCLSHGVCQCLCVCLCVCVWIVCVQSVYMRVVCVWIVCTGVVFHI